MKMGDIAKKIAIDHVKQKATREIIKGIKTWRNDKPGVAKRRWIFEIIQNALDTAKARNTKDISINIQITKNKAIIKHNAGYFDIKEINAIIYGGSSKPYAIDSQYIGRFGSGFLVTHILSRIPEIKGSLIDEKENLYGFTLTLDRTSDEPLDLAKSIDVAYSQLNSVNLQENLSEILTEYIYTANDELGKEALKVGLDELYKVIPFLFAFNDIEKITINDKTYRKIVNSENGLTVVNVGAKKVYLKEESSLLVAFLTENDEILSLENQPRIYVSLPLTSTADYIEIPFIINSPNIIPSEERDSISSEDINDDLLSQGFELGIGLISDFMEYGTDFRGFYNFLKFSIIDEAIFSAPIVSKLNNQIKNALTKIRSEIPLVKTHEGMLEFNEVIYPISNISVEWNVLINEECFWAFYDLLVQIKRNIPLRDSVNEWSMVAKDLDIIPLDEEVKLFTIKELIEGFKTYITSSNNKQKDISDFEKKFNLDDGKAFLLELTTLINILYQTKSFESPDIIDYLLLAQDNYIGARDWGDDHKLHISEEIPETLKEIVHKIGYKVREELVDDEFLKFEIVQDYVKDQLNCEQIIQNTIKGEEFEEKIDKSKWKEELDGWIELFNWCVNNENLCEGFPILTKDFQKVKIENLNTPLIIPPFAQIGIDAKYEVIFQSKRFMNQKYFDFSLSSLDQTDFLEKAKKYPVIITSLPLFKQTMKLKPSQLKTLTIDFSKASYEDNSHELEVVDEEESFSYLPFWEEVRSTISRSKKNAKIFIQFLLDYIMEEEREDFEPIEIKCSCSQNTHNLLPLEWLAHVKSDYWIPKESIQDGEKTLVKVTATHESVTGLFSKDDPENFNKLIHEYTEQVSLLFPHFGFDNLNLRILLHSITTDSSELDIRNKISKIVENVEEIIELMENFNIEEIRDAVSIVKEKKEKDQLLVDNKIIGENLEVIIRKIIADHGLNVVPIHTGGDMEIWPETQEGWDSGKFELDKTILEVKFTSGKRVHISKTQSKNARSLRETFSVLVVENVENLRQNLWNLNEPDVNNDLIDLVVNNSYIIDNLYQKLGVLPNPDEIEADINGYWLKVKLWRDRKNISEWLTSNFR